MLNPASTTPLAEEPMNLCVLGPCIRYHEIRSKLDAEEPLDGSSSPIFTHPIRTCYPSPGIEMPIGQSPVKECNLWEPRPDVIELRNRSRNVYLATADGIIDHGLFLASWKTPNPHAATTALMAKAQAAYEAVVATLAIERTTIGRPLPSDPSWSSLDAATQAKWRYYAATGDETQKPVLEGMNDDATR